jgi:hypothetical protein
MCRQWKESILDLRRRCVVEGAADGDGVPVGADLGDVDPGGCLRGDDASDSIDPRLNGRAEIYEDSFTPSTATSR